jgi:hypothetical protein
MLIDRVERMRFFEERGVGEGIRGVQGTCQLVRELAELDACSKI